VYAANPENPGVEHDIRTSVAEVQAELQRCRAVRDQCPRWRDLPLPGEINTSQIESLGYRYGEFRFELDRSAVLEMFTGEQLYEDPYAFLRELLQNAIDTVETRRRVHGEIPNNPDGVEVTCWEDEEGFLWVRVDDSGMGMDEHLIRNYFLRVGRSYYNSAEFQAELLRSKDGAGFVPISKFGIGVLSCFMVGDRVEVSTRRLLRGGRHAEMGEAFRLSLHRDRDYFVLRSKGQGDDDMPADSRGEQGFRRRAGTSIAVRVDTHRTGIELAKLTTKADEYLLAPPVRVTVNGHPAGVRRESRLNEPWCSEPHVATISTADRTARRSEFPHVGRFRIAALPLNLNASMPLTKVRGQFVALVVLPPADPDLTRSRSLFGDHPDGDSVAGGLLTNAVTNTYLSVHLDRTLPRRSEFETSLEVKVYRDVDRHQVSAALQILPAEVDNGERQGGLTETEELDRMLRSPAALADGLRAIRSERHTTVSSFPIDYAEIGIGPLQGRLEQPDENIRWAHGGIVLPGLSSAMMATDIVIRGVAVLTGRLRPDLTISRTSIVAVPFAVHSALQLAVRLAAQSVDAPAEAIERISRANLFDKSPAEPYTVATFRTDELLAGGAWSAQKVLRSASESLSVDEILVRNAAGEEFHVQLPWVRPWQPGRPPSFDFYRHMPAALMHFFLTLEYRPDEKTPGLYTVQRPLSPPPATSDLLPPLFAVPYRADPLLARAGSVLNANHPLTDWISTHAESLLREFASPFQRVLSQAHGTASADSVNAALERVARARTDIPAPPPEAYVRADENGRWWSR
jgi:hypothetical protein